MGGVLLRPNQSEHIRAWFCEGCRDNGGDRCLFDVLFGSQTHLDGLCASCVSSVAGPRSIDRVGYKHRSLVERLSL